MDSFIRAEPGELAFGEVSGELFHAIGGVFEGLVAVNVGEELAVAE